MANRPDAYMAHGWGDTSYVVCFDTGAPVFRFFGAPDDSACFSHKLQGSRMTIFAGPKGTAVESLPEIGHSEMTFEPGCRRESVTWLYLPTEQTVFSQIDQASSHQSRRFTIAWRELACMSGMYESTDGRIRRSFGLSGVSMNVFPPKISGVLDGVFFHNLFKNP